MFRFLPVALCLLILLISAGGLAADDPEPVATWVAPPLVDDNPVLVITQSRWTTPDGGIALLGTGYNYSDEDWHNPPDAFWELVKQSDAHDIIGEAKAVDGVAMSYWPPFTVWFPNVDINQEWGADPDRPDRTAFLRDWAASDKQILVFNPRDFDGSVPDMIMVIFKPIGAPNICHARQLITVLYSGTPDEAAFATCLTSQSP